MWRERDVTPIYPPMPYPAPPPGVRVRVPLAEDDTPPAAAGETARRRAALPWSFKDLEGVMLGVSRPLIAWGGEIYKWASRDLADDLDGLDEEVTEAKANDDAAGIAADIRGIEEGAERPNVWSYPTLLASGGAWQVSLATSQDAI